MGPTSENAGYFLHFFDLVAPSGRFNGSDVRERRLLLQRGRLAGGQAASMGPTSENAGYSEADGAG